MRELLAEDYVSVEFTPCVTYSHYLKIVLVMTETDNEVQLKRVTSIDFQKDKNFQIWKMNRNEYTNEIIFTFFIYMQSMQAIRATQRKLSRSQAQGLITKYGTKQKN